MTRLTAMMVTFKFGIAFLLLLTAACNKLEVFPKPPAPFLPAATTEGLNTYGCYVNDSLRVRNDRYLFNADYSKGSISILLSNFGSSLYYTESLSITSDKSIYNEGVFQLVSPSAEMSAHTGYAGYLGSGGLYYTIDSLGGTLEVTRLDTINFIISGKFSFQAINEDRTIVKIDSGRFDLKYIP